MALMEVIPLVPEVAIEGELRLSSHWWSLLSSFCHRNYSFLNQKQRSCSSNYVQNETYVQVGVIQ